MEICLGFGKTADKRSEEKRGGKGGGGEKKAVLNFHRSFIFLRRVHGVCLQFLCVINSKHLVKRTDKYTGFTICVHPKRKVFTTILFCRVDVKLEWGVAQ